MCMEKTVGLAVDTRDPFFGRIFVNGPASLLLPTLASSRMGPRLVQRPRVRPPLQLAPPEGPVRDPPRGLQHARPANRKLPRREGEKEARKGGCQVYPRPGLEFNTMMMVSFHSDLLTETDRVFHVKCQYYETQRSIGSFFEVRFRTLPALLHPFGSGRSWMDWSMLPTQIITSSFPVPSCKYTLHIQSVNGPMAQFARIGDKVFHRWECDSGSLPLPSALPSALSPLTLTCLETCTGSR